MSKTTPILLTGPPPIRETLNKLQDLINILRQCLKVNQWAYVSEFSQIKEEILYMF